MIRPAIAPRARGAARLLWIDPSRDRYEDRSIEALPALLAAGDLLVVNDAATLPGALPVLGLGAAVELRLLSAPDARGHVQAVLFGAGDWRLRTEDRPAPPAAAVGDTFSVADVPAEVLAVSALSPRLLTLALEGPKEAIWAALYAQGRPVQYSYLSGPLALWDVQTVYAGPPWAAEPPSAGLPLSWRLLRDLAAQGVGLTHLTHGAGLSSTGDPVLDQALPFPERYEIHSETVAAIAKAKAAGGRIIAVGTSVVRALEGASENGPLVAGQGSTALRLGPNSRLKQVDGLLTGIHVAGESHYDLLGAFVSEALLRRAEAHAGAAGYLAHEFGDAALVLPGRASATLAA